MIFATHGEPPAKPDEVLSRSVDSPGSVGGRAKDRMGALEPLSTGTNRISMDYTTKRYLRTISP